MAIVCLGLELTDRCNLACAHCLRYVVPPHAQRARDLDLGLVRRLVGEARALDIPRIALTGGEPMLHPAFLEIVDAICAEGLSYHFLSNGHGLPLLLPRLFARPERRKQLGYVCVSLDGATADTHDRVRGRGSFRQTVAGIAVLRALGVPFHLLACVSRASLHEIDLLGLLAHHLGAERLYFTHYLPNGRPHATEDLDLTIEERYRAEAMIKRLMHAMRFEIGMGEGYATSVVDHTCATVDLRLVNVDPSGHVTFCCELSNFYGESRPPETRSDWVADLSQVSLAEAIRRQQAAIARFRSERIEAELCGTRGADDRFACRFCVRHFGKPERGIVPLRRRPASPVDSAVETGIR
jgi:MoaA/NifB/PqqE/SkfB family radical SAM enzyme